jgi:hypothetical protein
LNPRGLHARNNKPPLSHAGPGPFCGAASCTAPACGALTACASRRPRTHRRIPSAHTAHKGAEGTGNPPTNAGLLYTSPAEHTETTASTGNVRRGDGTNAGERGDGKGGTAPTYRPIQESTVMVESACWTSTRPPNSSSALALTGLSTARRQTQASQACNSAPRPYSSSALALTGLSTARKQTQASQACNSAPRPSQRDGAASRKVSPRAGRVIPLNHLPPTTHPPPTRHPLATRSPPARHPPPTAHQPTRPTLLPHKRTETTLTTAPGGRTWHRERTPW